jgi:hypothetical protein
MSSADLPVPPIPPDLPPEPAPDTPPDRDNLLSWIATSNPFYVISAGLFLFGLKMSFGEHTRDIDSWALMTGLGGYTLLLASAALLLVRYAKVWNDVRTVLLLMVLMFLATSVTFDELLVLDPDRGAWFYAAGLVFSVAVTEAVLSGIRLKLPVGFRLPYYLTLGLFFLYPVFLTPVLNEPHSEELMWGLFGFSPAAGLTFLTLLPAIRRGPGYVRDNGSPWPWPYYPWSLFVFLAAAVIGRSFLLCWSLHLLGGSNRIELIFGPYFLVPFGFAIALLVLELGLVARSRVTTSIVMAVPVGLAVLAGVGHRPDAVYHEFLAIFTDRLGGTPLYLTILAAGGFYLYAWLRGVALAPEGLTGVLIALAFVRPETLDLGDVRFVSEVPLIAAWALQFGLGLWRREIWRWGLLGGAPAAWVAIEGWRGYRLLRAEVAGLDYLVVGLLLFPIAVLISLGKAGVLNRWFETWRNRTPPSSG